MSKDYWYILHIPTGGILEYHNKNYSKVRHANWKKAQKTLKISGTENKLLHKLGLYPEVDDWSYSNIPNSSQQSDDDFVAWVALPIKTTTTSEVDYIFRIQAMHFATLLDTRRSNSIMKFVDKLDARDCLKFILLNAKMMGYSKYSIDEFAVLCSDGSMYDFQSQTLAAKRKAKQLQTQQDTVVETT